MNFYSLLFSVMKTSISAAVVFLALFIPVVVVAQCSITINPSGPINLCDGDSIMLVAKGGGALTQAPDQSQLVYNAGTSARTLPGYSHWQSFTAGITGTLSQIDLGYFNYINGSGTLNIFAGAGTAGTLLQSQTINVYCPAGNCMLPFSVSAPVVLGQQYTFQFIPGAGMPDPYGVQVEMPGTYPGGEMAIVDPSGTYMTGFDMVFKTYVSSGYSYLWSTGSTDTSIVVHTSNNYSVTVLDPLGCSASDTVSVTVNPIPAAPVITQVGNTLVSNYVTGNQWYNATGPIAGATGQVFAPTINGVYHCIVTVNGCSSASSNLLDFNLTGISENKGTIDDIRVFPNPVTDQLTVDLSSASNEIVSVILFDMTGRTVFIKDFLPETNDPTSSLDLSWLDSGMYFLCVRDRITQHIIKLVKE